MPTRRFVDQAVVIATGAQTPQDRFGKRPRESDYDDVPAISPWRSNLTGLSQTENLYFVAYSNKIHVYVPQYSTQALPRDPALVVTSEPSRPGLEGYLDRRNPHAINSLVVQFLGTEEVVAVVRDDGDVDAFLVRHILQAIENTRAPEVDISLSRAADVVRQIFQSNVGMSAWGLAIHSHARVIAVSANSHNITIFKLGLVETDKEDRASHRPKRHDDVTQQILNGTSNVPNIAFCNTGDDPEARWLLTTDITGFCRSIDLFEMRTTQTFRFGRPITYLNSSDHDPINSGWFVGFLDRRSFVQQDNVYTALGMEESDGMDGIPPIWDIGQTLRHVPDTNSKFPVARSERSRRRRTQPPSVSSPGVRSPPTEPHTIGTTEESVSLASVATTGSQDLGYSAGDEAPGEAAAQMQDPYRPESDDEGGYESGSSIHYVDDMDIEGEGTEDSPSFSAMYGGRRTYGNAPRAYQPHNRICDLPCPILHASVRNVYLLQPSTKGDSSPFTPPTIGLANALHQLVPSGISYFNVFERLNMNAYIPSIGVVVLASQKGRAMVLSLTKLANKTARYPTAWQRSAIPASKNTYTMRLEFVLPYAHQEEDGDRPVGPLAGIATGPIQGTEHLSDQQKRWRLMLYYADHTVLSYEIRRRWVRDSAVDVQDVVV